MNADIISKDVRSILQRKFGAAKQFKKGNVFSFGTSMSCSINYSKLLHGHKYFYAFPQDMQLIRPSFRTLLPICQFIAFEAIEEQFKRLEAFPIDSGARVTDSFAASASRLTKPLYCLPAYELVDQLPSSRPWTEHVGRTPGPWRSPEQRQAEHFRVECFEERLRCDATLR